MSKKMINVKVKSIYNLPYLRMRSYKTIDEEIDFILHYFRNIIKNEELDLNVTINSEKGDVYEFYPKSKTLKINGKIQNGKAELFLNIEKKETEKEEIKIVLYFEIE